MIISKNIRKNLKFKRLDILEKIQFRPLPQYSKDESLTETEKDMSLFSISILFSLKNLIKFGYVSKLNTIKPISIGTFLVPNVKSIV